MADTEGRALVRSATVGAVAGARAVAAGVWSVAKSPAKVGKLPVFTVQVLISATGMALCATMLAIGRDAAVYLPVVTSIVAYWLPAPTRPGAAPAPPRAGLVGDDLAGAGSQRGSNTDARRLSGGGAADRQDRQDRQDHWEDTASSTAAQGAAAQGAGAAPRPAASADLSAAEAGEAAHRRRPRPQHPPGGRA